MKSWSGSRCCRFWRWPRREAQRRYPLRSRPSEQRRPAPKSTQPSTARGRRAAGGVARSLQPTAGMRLPRSLPFRPSASTRDPLQDFNSLLGRGQMGASSLDPSFEALGSAARGHPATPRKRPPRITRTSRIKKARDWHAFLIAPTAIKVSRKKVHVL